MVLGRHLYYLTMFYEEVEKAYRKGNRRRFQRRVKAFYNFCSQMEIDAVTMPDVKTMVEGVQQMESAVKDSGTWWSRFWGSLNRH